MMTKTSTIMENAIEFEMTFEDLYKYVIGLLKNEHYNNEGLDNHCVISNLKNFSVVDVFGQLDMLDWENKEDENKPCYSYKWDMIVSNLLDEETIMHMIDMLIEEVL